MDFNLINVKVYPRFFFDDSDPLSQRAIFKVTFKCDRCGAEISIVENDWQKITSFFDENGWEWDEEDPDNIYCGECCSDLRYENLTDKEKKADQKEYLANVRE